MKTLSNGTRCGNAAADARYGAMRFGRARYWMRVHWHAWSRAVRYFAPEIVGMAIIVVLAAIGLAALGCSPMRYQGGVPNLDRVEDNVYRSGQIATAEGWDTIAKIAGNRKIHVVKLNFDAEGADAIALARGYDVRLLSIQPEGDRDVLDDVEDTFKRPDAARVAAALALLAEAHTRVATDFYLVHCTHGQDRTGLVVGEHRVLSDGWPKDRAYKEMRAHHFHWELVGLSVTWSELRAASSAPGSP